MVPSTARPLGSSPTTPGSIKNKLKFFFLSLSVNTRCKGIKPQKCVTSFFTKQICSPCLTGKGLGWGIGYKTTCGAGRVGQSFRMLSRVCLVLDLEGFEVQGQFLVHELGWCDWTGQHWGTTHYYPTKPYPEALKDQRLVRFVRRHIHGLPYTPAHREQAPPAAALKQDVKELVHTFQQPDGGGLQRRTLRKRAIAALGHPAFQLGTSPVS